jgi:hypothetical protein
MLMMIPAGYSDMCGICPWVQAVMNAAMPIGNFTDHTWTERIFT